MSERTDEMLDAIERVTVDGDMTPEARDAANQAVVFLDAYIAELEAAARAVAFSEREPEEDQWVLVWDVAYLAWQPRNWFKHGALNSDVRLGYVTHWRPMLPPPTEAQP